MSSQRCNWFVDEIDVVVTADPFDAPIEEVGTRIDLRTQPDLIVRLSQLLHDEAELDAHGHRCAIRDRPETACSACPVSEATTKTEFGALCRNGIEQEHVLSSIAVVQERER